ncbi:MAG TPA: MBL fold metallo-hydrolase [Actinoplanes sp.]|nr:MBL fold metallo-hydrolase [Actinoplanes sp.]
MTIAAQLGGKAAGARRTRVESSPQFSGGRFRNTVPTATGVPLAAFPRMAATALTSRRPTGPVPVVSPAAATTTGLHITWYGHSSALIEIEGRRVMLDPVWSRRCSPSQLAGPRRLHEAPIPLAELPALDAVVISHDHYDHLDMPTVRDLAALQPSMVFVVPLGVGAHLETWGVAESRIVELDWNESTRIGDDLELVATPARHFSGRRGVGSDDTLWASWVIKGPARSVFYSGDTGYFPGFAEIGAEHGPFDATLVQVGAYSPDWADIHMFPEDGVATHLDVRGGLMIPVHWATFDLAPHRWAEPPERTWREAKARDVRLAIPRPGERVDVDNPPELDPWWDQIA